MFGWLRRIFRRKKNETEDVGLENLPPVSQTKSSSFPSVETTSNENVRARLDLVLTQLESLNLRYETLNGRIQNLERMITEIHEIAKKP